MFVYFWLFFLTFGLVDLIRLIRCFISIGFNTISDMRLNETGAKSKCNKTNISVIYLGKIGHVPPAITL